MAHMDVLWLILVYLIEAPAVHPSTAEESTRLDSN